MPGCWACFWDRAGGCGGGGCHSIERWSCTSASWRSWRVSLCVWDSGFERFQIKNASIYSVLVTTSLCSWVCDSSLHFVTQQEAKGSHSFAESLWHALYSMGLWVPGLESLWRWFGCSKTVLKCRLFSCLRRSAMDKYLVGEKTPSCNGQTL